MKTVMQMVRMSAYVGVSLVAMGCTKTVTVPASQIPVLSEGLYGSGKDYPTVYTVEGQTEKVTRAGDTIEIQMGSQVDTFAAPYTARIEDRNLVVSNAYMGRDYRKEYPLALNPTGTLEIRRDRKAGGGVLVALGVPAVVAGTTLIAVGASSGGFEGGLALVLGTMVAGHGLAMTIPGVYLLNTDPKKPARTGQTEIAPTLQVGPTGANLTVPF